MVTVTGKARIGPAPGRAWGMGKELGKCPSENVVAYPDVVYVVVVMAVGLGVSVGMSA